MYVQDKRAEEKKERKGGTHIRVLENDKVWLIVPGRLKWKIYVLIRCDFYFVKHDNDMHLYRSNISFSYTQLKMPSTKILILLGVSV